MQTSDEIDPQLNQDLINVMQKTSEEFHIPFPEGSFRRVFCDQQIKNAKQKDSRQIRWHPLIIKWCLNMRLISSASYHVMRTTGFITLPSERTLRDYTNYIARTHVIQQEVVHQMRQEAKVNDLYDPIRVVESTGLKLIALLQMVLAQTENIFVCMGLEGGPFTRQRTYMLTMTYSLFQTHCN